MGGPRAGGAWPVGPLTQRPRCTHNRGVPLGSLLVPLAWVSWVATGDVEEASWRFRKADRPVKVAVIAGSMGAYPKGPFHAQLERVCTRIEVKNLSKTGIGAYAMKRRFRAEVLENRRIGPGKVEGEEHWLFFASGVNSIGMPRSTNHHLRGMIQLAHAHGIKVVGLSPAPWGTEKNPKFRGVEGLRRRKATQLVTDFVTGRATPEQALGEHARKRAAGPWTAAELPDIGVDIYDSPLRDEGAAQRDLQAMRETIAADRTWAREHIELSEADRAAQLEADAWLAADMPRWFMKRELQAFDHIHPNEDGHRVIAQVTCPALPVSWGCDCSAL
jgi:hypothetical protein